jgi:hypothetical protein
MCVEKATAKGSTAANAVRQMVMVLFSVFEFDLV